MNHEDNRGPATREQLWAIWSGLVDAFTDYLDNTPPERIRASMLDVIRAFLKDNKVTVDGAHLADLKNHLSSLQGLALPFSDTEH